METIAFVIEDGSLSGVYATRDEEVRVVVVDHDWPDGARCSVQDVQPLNEAGEDVVGMVNDALGPMPLCECSDCECSEIATVEDPASGVSLCEACADYTVGPDGEVICSRMTASGTRCPKCKESISWGDIQTGAPGTPNMRPGICHCPGAGFHWEQRDEGGTWRTYYVAEEVPQ